MDKAILDFIDQLNDDGCGDCIVECAKRLQNDDL